MVRFHLDEHVADAVAIGLRRRGIDVTTTVDAGLCGGDDPAHLAFARSQSRVIVTHDEDFLALHAGGASHFGIIYCHQGTRSVRELIRALLLIHECLTPEDMKNHVESI